MFSNPYMNIDFNKFYAQFAGKSADFQRLIELQKKNMDALLEAYRVASSGTEVLMKQQLEVFKKGLDETIDALTLLLQSPTFEEGMKQQQQMGRKSIERVISNLGDLSTQATQTNVETLEIVRKRYQECLEELKTAFGG